jgi:hypothetical protein
LKASILQRAFDLVLIMLPERDLIEVRWIQALIPFGTTRKQLQLPSTRAKIPVKTDFGAIGKSQTRMPGEP